MRKSQKTQAEDMISLLWQAHDEIKKFIETGKTEDAVTLLAQCQDGAIQMGNLIERTEGEGFVIIGMLEHYCELIYQIHEELIQEQSVSVDINSINKLFKNLRKELIRIENSLKYDIKVRIEAVFLPYKASMWDSLESVWIAAHEDPDCDDYVIPIPYYDKNPDGSFREMHYEGNLYPDYVPITPYETFDFAAHRPDMIFIHNPYDEYNHVTSVHPFCYSKNLKQFTEQLVYIPYYILGERDPDDKESVAKIEHFCNVPAVVYADKVIVQSENMRKIYINTMMKLLGNTMGDRSYWEQKILGLGSPKVDKVLNTKKEDLEIPEEWLKFIRKSDGSFKKIIFYNTSVSALLQHNQQMLAKMEDVFRFFDRNRDDIALLWRPHPLIKATIESMRPQLWEAYAKLEQRYRSEGWGIYDDTPDLNRAVALSDAYYGDASSVTQLFRQVGKQHVIQKPTWRNDVPYPIAITEAIAYVDGKYWYVPYWSQDLYCMDGSGFETTKVYRFSEKEGEALFCGMVSYGKRLFMVPKLASYIWIYDIEEESGHQIEVQERDEIEAVRYSKFLSWVIIDGYLYLIPCRYHSLVCINLETEELEVYRIDQGKECQAVSRYNAAVMNNDIYFLYEAESCLIKFDTKQKVMEKVYPGNEKRVYTSLFSINQKIWLIPFHAKDGIRVWDVYTNKFEDILVIPDEAVEKPKESELGKLPTAIADNIRNGKTPNFKLGTVFGQEIHLLAGTYGKNIIIDTKERKIKSWDMEVDCFEEILYTWIRGIKFISFLKKEDELYVISGISGEWYRYSEGEWKQVEKSSSMVSNGKKVLILDRELFDQENAEKLSVSGKAGNAIYESLKKE